MNRRQFLISSGLLTCSGLGGRADAAIRAPVMVMEGASSHPLMPHLVEAIKKHVAKQWGSQAVRWEFLNHQGNVDRAVDGFSQIAARSDALCVLGGCDWNVTPVLVQEAARLKLPYGIAWASNTHLLDRANGWSSRCALQDDLLVERLLAQMKVHGKKLLGLLLVDDAAGRSLQEATLLGLAQYPDIELLGIDWHTRGDAASLIENYLRLQHLGVDTILLGAYPMVMPALWKVIRSTRQRPDLFVGLSGASWGASADWRHSVAYYAPNALGSVQALEQQVAGLLQQLLPNDSQSWSREQLHERIEGQTLGQAPQEHRWVLQT